MEFSKMHVFEVFTNRDLCEGRCGSISLGLFQTKSLADAVAKGRGVQGSNADVSESLRDVVELEGKVYVIGAQVLNDRQYTKNLREQALNKLTPKEREILGITQEHLNALEMK